MYSSSKLRMWDGLRKQVGSDVLPISGSEALRLWLNDVINLHDVGMTEPAVERYTVCSGKARRAGTACLVIMAVSRRIRLQSTKSSNMCLTCQLPHT